MTASTLTLRDYQQDCVDATLAAFRNGKSQRLLNVLPTGAGKTILFAALIARLRDGVRSLVLAHREELLDQAAEKIRYVIPDADIGIVQAGRNQCDAQIVIASVATIRNKKRRNQLGQFGFIVVDEAHHSAAQSYREILDDLGAFAPGGPRLLGVTATPDRGDGVGLSEVFETIGYEIGILDLIMRGYLSDVRGKRISLEMDLDSVHSRGGDYVEGELGEAMLNAHAPQAIAEAITAYASDRKTIVFTPTVEVATETAAAIRGAGMRADAVSGKTPAGDRRRILNDLRHGDLQVVVNCMVLTEGFDCPPVDCIVMARPTQSRALYQQCIGRGLRKFPDKHDCLILDLAGVTQRHDLESAASLFGLPTDALDKGGTATEVVARLQREDVAAAAALNLLATDVELFRTSDLNWIRTPGGAYVLATGSESYLLRCLSDQDCTIHRVTTGDRNREDRIDEVRNGVTLEFAQGIVEDIARRNGTNLLIAKESSWRDRPISEGQRRMLWVLKVSSVGIKTQGQASNTIAAAKADQALERITRRPTLRERVQGPNSLGGHVERGVAA